MAERICGLYFYDLGAGVSFSDLSPYLEPDTEIVELRTPLWDGGKSDHGYIQEYADQVIAAGADLLVSFCAGASAACRIAEVVNQARGTADPLSVVLIDPVRVTAATVRTEFVQILDRYRTPAQKVVAPSIGETLASLPADVAVKTIFKVAEQQAQLLADERGLPAASPARTAIFDDLSEHCQWLSYLVMACDWSPVGLTADAVLVMSDFAVKFDPRMWREAPVTALDITHREALESKAVAEILKKL